MLTLKAFWSLRYIVVRQDMQQRVLLVLLFATVCIGCSPDTGKMVPLMPNSFANLVIVYKKGTTDEQISNFWNKLLSRTSSDSPLFPAIDTILKIKESSGYSLTAIVYHSHATPEQREDVKKAALGSPIVYKVLENVKPNEIKRIE